MSFEDKSLQCRECGQTFIWTEGEQAFYAEKGLMNTPSRCPQCRKARRANVGTTLAEGSESRGARSENRVQHPVTCAACGKETTVPFVPKYDRPVYCSECFDRERAAVR